MSGTGQRRLKIPEPIRGLARAAKKQKWTITYNGSGHLVWTSPTGEAVVMSSTPSDSRFLRQVKAKLRSAGLRIEG